MSRMREESQQALEALVTGDPFEGAAMVRRDGLPVIGRFRRNISEETWAAMSAAMLGAAEAAFEEWGADAPSMAIIHGPGARMAVLGLDDETLLVLIGPAAGALAAFVEASQEAHARLAVVLGEA